MYIMRQFYYQQIICSKNLNLSLIILYYLYQGFTNLKHMNSVLSRDNITCPITRLIFYEPVILSDGKTYEKDYIVKWLKNNKTSPLTREIINSDIISNDIIKKIVDDYLLVFPNEKNNQYQPDLSYTFNKSIIKKLIEENNFDNLIKFTDYENFC